MTCFPDRTRTTLFHISVNTQWVCFVQQLASCKGTVGIIFIPARGDLRSRHWLWRHSAPSLPSCCTRSIDGEMISANNHLLTLILNFSSILCVFVVHVEVKTCGEVLQWGWNLRFLVCSSLVWLHSWEASLDYPTVFFFTTKQQW